MLLNDFINQMVSDLKQTKLIIFKREYIRVFNQYINKYLPHVKVLETNKFVNIDYKHHIAIVVKTGKKSNYKLFYIGFNLDETETYMVSAGIVRQIIKVDVLEDINQFCQELQQSFKDKYNDQVQNFIRLAESFHLSKEQAIELGIAFSQLNSDTKDLLLENNNKFFN